MNLKLLIFFFHRAILSSVLKKRILKDLGQEIKLDLCFQKLVLITKSVNSTQFTTEPKNLVKQEMTEYL